MGDSWAIGGYGGGRGPRRSKSLNKIGEKSQKSGKNRKIIFRLEMV